MIALRTLANTAVCVLKSGTRIDVCVTASLPHILANSARKVSSISLNIKDIYLKRFVLKEAKDIP